jgi:hypothetical protein
LTTSDDADIFFDIFVENARWSEVGTSPELGTR